MSRIGIRSLDYKNHLYFNVKLKIWFFEVEVDFEEAKHLKRNNNKIDVQNRVLDHDDYENLFIVKHRIMFFEVEFDFEKVKFVFPYKAEQQQN